MTYTAKALYAFKKKKKNNSSEKDKLSIKSVSLHIFR